MLFGLRGSFALASRAWQDSAMASMGQAGAEEERRDQQPAAEPRVLQNDLP